MRDFSDSEAPDWGSPGWGAGRRPGGQRPGEALIAGGFQPRSRVARDGVARDEAYRPARSRRHPTARAAAPLAVPVALGITLGVILAVSSGPTHAHVTQGNSGHTSSATATVSPAVP
jgi:hypothetical protein